MEYLSVDICFRLANKNSDKSVFIAFGTFDFDVHLGIVLNKSKKVVHLMKVRQMSTTDFGEITHSLKVISTVYFDIKIDKDFP